MIQTASNPFLLTTSDFLLISLLNWCGMCHWIKFWKSSLKKFIYFTMTRETWIINLSLRTDNLHHLEERNINNLLFFLLYWKRWNNLCNLWQQKHLHCAKKVIVFLQYYDEVLQLNQYCQTLSWALPSHFDLKLFDRLHRYSSLLGVECLI